MNEKEEFVFDNNANSISNKNTLKVIKEKYLMLLLLVVMSVLSCFFIAFRNYKSETFTYRFLIWNLFLAWIPLIAALILKKVSTISNSKPLIILMFIIWLLFFPNSPYILTDLFHIIDLRDKIPVWYDLMLILSFAWLGLVLGLYSLMEIHLFIKKKFNFFISWIIVSIMIVLGSFGVFLGRYQRWNSWNIITNPIPLFKDLILQLENIQVIGFTVFFSFFLMMAYLTFYSISEMKKD